MKRLFIWGVIPAVGLLGAAACGGKSDPAETAAAGAETSAFQQVEYVVYVDEAPLRAQPSDDAAILKILKRDARVKNRSEVVTEVEGRYWRRVEVAGKCGWVPDEYVLPDYFYDPFEKADKLGRAGDGDGMVAAAIEGNKKVGYVEQDEDYCYHVSPDGEKVFVNLEYGEPRLWSFGYPDIHLAFQPVPVIYLVNGRGLARYFFCDVFIPGEWTADSRYFVYAEPDRIELIDTEEWSRKRLGPRNYVGNRSGDFPSPEISGDYVIWLSWEEPTKPLPSPFDEGLSVPVLLAYDLGTGDVTRILGADLTTLNDEIHSEDSGYCYYEIKMAEAGLCPPDVGESKLFKRFNGVYCLAESE